MSRISGPEWWISTFVLVLFALLCMWLQFQRGVYR